MLQTWVHAQDPCPLQSVSFSPDSIIICDSTTNLSITSTIEQDTSPIFLKTESSFPNFRFWFTREFDTEDNGCTYVLKISGQYTVWSNWWWFDALYTFDPNTNLQTSDDDPIGLSISPADYVLPTDYNDQHEYYFYYTGDGSTKTVRFFDLGQFSDNEGSLTFEWYVIPCYETQWSIDTQVVSSQENLQTIVNDYGAHPINLEVRDLITGCSLSYSGLLTLVEPPIVQLDIQPSCRGDNNAVVLADVLNSTQVTYQWGHSISTNPFLVNQSPGNFLLTVENEYGCTTDVNFQIPSIPAIQANIATVSSCADEQNGEATIQIQSGDGPFQYFWSNLVTDSVSISGIAAGNYDVSVYDTYGCENVFAFSIDEFEPIEYNVVTTPSCINSATGSIELMPSSGVGPFQYSWNAAQLNNSASQASIYSGQYEVTITDQNACQKTESIFVAEHPNLLHSIDATPSCINEANGTLNAQILSGVAPYSFVWSNNTYSQSNDLLGAGMYYLTIEDGNNCPFFDSSLVENYALPEISEIAQAACPNLPTGSYQVNIESGQAPFLFEWDAGQTDSSLLKNLSTGNYTFTLTDGFQCEHYFDFTIEEKPTLTPSFEIYNVKCFGYDDGQLIIDSSGIEAVFSLDNETFQQNPAFSQLEAGKYQLFLQDNDGCIFMDSFEIKEPDEMRLDVINAATILVGESIQLNVDVSGGNSNYTFVWDPVTQLSCSDCPNPIASPENTQTYTIIVSDQEGCQKIEQVRIIVDVIENRPIFVPSAFSPNDDGLNDYLTIFSDQNASLIKNFMVFDRWGNMIFEKEEFPTNEVDKGWDGTFNNKSIQEGVYVWRATIIWRDGKITYHSGESTLLR